jgi:hypothetical protein
MLTDREKEILNCMVNAWQNNDAPMIGGCSYAEVFETLERLGLMKPEKLEADLNNFQRMFDEERRGRK